MSVILSLVILLMGLTQPVLAQPSDTTGHWAAKQINDWVSQGLAKGYSDGSFKPDSTITRAEYITLVNKAFGFSQSAQASFSDVRSTDWFAGEIAKAKAAGYISGYEDGTIKPNNQISRQEAAAMLAKVLKLNTSDLDVVNKFKDGKGIPRWSRGSVGAVVVKGCMNGYPDQTYQPEKAITRAEAISTLDRAKSQTKTVTYSKAGTYGPASGTEAVDGNVSITVADVNLQNMIINGDLLVAEGVGDGNVHLKNVTVKGATNIKGGGAHSVTLEDCTLPSITIDRDGVRVVASGTTTVSIVTLQSGAVLVQATISG
ncbi:MAG: S-layer homology domain-containing protein, partial [Desulfocucumaceae bacterium]